MSDFTAAACALSGLIGILFHWTPDQFWHATPQEVETLLLALKGAGEANGASGSAPPDAQTMAALCRAFPDET